jgi:hypothetical protein
MIKNICVCAAVLLVLTAGCARRGEHRVVAALPAIESILSDLTAGTSIEVVKAIPGDISLSEIKGFLETHGPLLDSLARCDAVAGLHSIIPQDEVYLFLRTRNIRIVEIDCAMPLDPGIVPIPLIKNDGAAVPYAWLSATACMKMAEIASKDLAKLYPADTAALRANLKAFKARYFDLMSTYESLFARIADFQAAAMTADFDYFLKDVGLFVTFLFPPDEAFWPDPVKRDFRAALKSGHIRTIVHRWKPSGPVGALIDSCNVRTAVLCAGDPAMKSYTGGLFGLLEKNYAALYDAFKK